MDERPTTLICPECGGALQPVQQGRLLQYHCHVGHTFGLQSLQAAYDERIEQTLWAALRALQEQQLLMQQMMERTSNKRFREEYQKQADAASEHADNIREMLHHFSTQTTPGKI